MIKNISLLNLVNVLVIIVPMLLSVAFMTIIERKQLAAHQRRVGPQVTWYFGVLQPLKKKISERFLFSTLNNFFLILNKVLNNNKTEIYAERYI